MHSLTELRDFLASKEIEIKEFNGWRLIVGKDIWTMLQDSFYKNNEKQSNQTRKWRGINCRNRR